MVNYSVYNYLMLTITVTITIDRCSSYIMATPQETVIDRNSAFLAFQENFIDLTTTSLDPLWLANHLFTNHVITLQQMKDATDDCLRASVKLNKLLTLVLEAVQRNGHVYTILLNILSKEEVYSSLIEKIEKSYETLHSQSVPQHEPFIKRHEYKQPTSSEHEPTDNTQVFSQSTCGGDEDTTPQQLKGAYICIHV